MAALATGAGPLNALPLRAGWWNLTMLVPLAGLLALWWLLVRLCLEPPAASEEGDALRGAGLPARGARAEPLPAGQGSAAWGPAGPVPGAAQAPGGPARRR